MKVIIGIPSRGTKLFNKRGSPTEVRVDGINHEYVLPFGLEHMARVIRESKKIADIEVVHIVDEHNVRLVDAQRNLVIEECLKRGGDFVWLWDDDTYPPLNALELLLSVKKPIISGIYWGKAPTEVMVLGGSWAMEKQEDIFPIEVNEKNPGYVNGMGCVLIDAKFLNNLKRPFIPPISEWKNGWGDDYMFFDKIFNETGERCWIHKKILCDHYDWHTDRWYPDEKVCIKWSGRKKFAILESDQQSHLYGVYNRENRQHYDAIIDLLLNHVCHGDKNKPFNFLEIGTLYGNTERILYGEFPNARLYGVDTLSNPFSKRYEDRVKFIQARSDDAVEYFKAQGIKFQMIFIDADHSYGQVKKDILNYQSLIEAGGILAGHDYNKLKFPHVVDAVDELIPNVDKTYEDAWVWWTKL